ncbi:hypothetical protein [Roseomonas mucosa]|uniref:hypothetical protein n=1 Tax=Roseomonas mucosa TaxID=207340 RepID=UPI00224702C3|nr:hypothetical protein [Roseomonas mucosa]UZO94726.1 Hypothetical protein RMP42_05081a [Roseomonas mucosa]
MLASAVAASVAASPLILKSEGTAWSASYRNDDVLRGLVARGHGLDAISVFLQNSCDEVLENVVRLGLPTPHDRQFRAHSGPRAWNPADYLSFIQDWTAGLHAESIGFRLGRSAGAVYAKVRWFGLPKRERGRIHRAGVPSASQTVEASLKPQTVEAAYQSIFTADGSRLTIRKMLKRNQIFWTPELDVELGNRYWANQHHIAIAKEWGVSSGSIRSRANRLQLPPRERSELVEHYDPSVIKANIAGANYVYRKCSHAKDWFFWAHRNGDRISKRGKKVQARQGRSSLVTDYSISCDVSSFGL